MPYYLVTQTSLVEAKDEVAAAKHVLAKLQDAQKVIFTVKFDEKNIRQVTVQSARPVTVPLPDPIVEQDKASHAAAGVPQPVLAIEQSHASSFRARRNLAAFMLFISGTLVGVIAHWLVS